MHGTQQTPICNVLRNLISAIIPQPSLPKPTGVRSQGTGIHRVYMYCTTGRTPLCSVWVHNGSRNHTNQSWLASHRFQKHYNIRQMLQIAFSSSTVLYVRKAAPTQQWSRVGQQRGYTEYMSADISGSRIQNHVKV